MSREKKKTLFLRFHENKMPCYPLRYYNFCNVEGRQEHEKKALFLIRLEDTSQLSDFLKCF